MNDLLNNIALLNDIALSAYRGDFENIKQLLQNGLDINAKIQDDTTLLVHAVNGVQYELCKYLIKNGADVNIIVEDDNKLQNLLTLIIKNPHYIKNTSSYTNVKIFQLLIDNGCDVNYMNDFQLTPLVYSIFNYSRNQKVGCNYNEYTEILLKHGANPNPKTINFPLLHRASSSYSRDVCELLIEYGADVLAKDEYGHYASHWCSYHSVECYNFLKQKEEEQELLNKSFKRAQIEDENDTDDDDDDKKLISNT